MLPDFLQPMLSQPGQPFDDDTCLFEIKWDGIRLLAFIEEGTCRLMTRRKFNATERYPELSFLAELPSGTILDGEIVVLKDGKPDFALLESREHSRNPLRIRTMSSSLPVTYVVFDVPYLAGKSIMSKPLSQRREELARLVKSAKSPRLVLSDGVVGQGTAFFREVVKRGLEGVVAKRLDSKYLPGKRTGAWIKIKRSEVYECAIIGFEPDGPKDFRSLIIATLIDGKLTACGKVGSGINVKTHKQLNDLLWQRLRAKPIVPCKNKGKWVEPGLYCRVSCMERSPSGVLRAPVFEDLTVDS